MILLKQKLLSCILLILLSTALFAGFTNYALAQGLSDFESNLDIVAGEAEYDTDVSNPEQIISPVITAILSLMGVIFLILMIYGGFLWMTARGNEEQVKKAKDLITAAIVGLIIIISAYAISYFVVSKLGGAALKS